MRQNLIPCLIHNLIGENRMSGKNNLTKKLAFLLVFTTLFAAQGFAATPDVNLHSPNGGLYIKGGATQAIEFYITSSDANSFLIDLNYSATNTQGSGVAIISDVNTGTGGISCETTNFSTPKKCSYDWTVPSVDGNYYLLVDIDLNNGVDTNFDASNETIYIDSTAPLAHAVVPSTDYNSSDQNVQFNCHDTANASGFASLTIGETTYTDQNVWVNYDSNTLVSFYCTDVAGNQSDTNAVAIMIDKAAPTIAGKSPASGADTNDSTPRIEFDLNDSSAGIKIESIQISIDGNNLTMQRDINVVGFDSNRHMHFTWDANYSFADGKTITIDVNTFDNADNNAIGLAANTWSFTVDTEAPTSTSMTNISATNDSTPTITVSATGASHMRFSCSSTTIWEAPVTYATTYSEFNIVSDANCTSGDGNKTIYVQFGDAAGNWTTTPTVGYIIYDTTNPSAPSNFSASSGNARVALAWDGVSGASSYKIYIDSSTYVGSTAGTSYTVSTHPVYIDSSTYVGSTAGTSYTVSTHPVTGNSLVNGTSYDFKVIAVDAAGNESAYSDTKSATPSSSAGDDDDDTPTQSDTTDPSVSWISPGSGATISGTIDLKVSASDSSGIYMIRFYVDDILLENVTSKTGLYYILSWDSTSKQDGSQTLKAIALDNASPTKNTKVVERTITTDNGVAVTTTGTRAEAETAIATTTTTRETVDAKVVDFTNRGISIDAGTLEIIDDAKDKLENAKTQEDAANYGGAKNLANNAKIAYENALNALSIETYTNQVYEYNSEEAVSALRAAGVVPAIVDNYDAISKTYTAARSLEIVKIGTDDDANYLANIKIIVENTSSDITSIKIIEIIPKDFADSASKIVSNIDFEVLQDDPVIVFTVELAQGEQAEIFYGLGEDLNETTVTELEASNLMEKFQAPPVLVSKETEVNADSFNAISSAVVVAAGLDLSGITYWIAIIFIVIAVLAVVAFLALNYMQKKEKVSRAFGLHSVIKDEPFHKKLTDSAKNILNRGKGSDSQHPKWAFKKK